MTTAPGERGPAILLDIDGVLHVGDEPIPGAVAALTELRSRTRGLRLVTNTTSKARHEIVDQLLALGFEVEAGEVLTPAALAVAHCRRQGYARVALLVGDSLRADLAGLEEAERGAPADAVVLGDLGDGFTSTVMNTAFRLLMDGAELVALQHNRYWRRSDGLVLDVGAYAAALEYATGRPAFVVGKPSPQFFAAALADIGVAADDALMVGDDVEADVGGALDAGVRAVLVRTGKFQAGAAAAAGIEPTATVDSVAAVPGLVRSLRPAPPPPLRPA